MLYSGDEFYPDEVTSVNEDEFDIDDEQPTLPQSDYPEDFPTQEQP